MLLWKLGCQNYKVMNVKRSKVQFSFNIPATNVSTQTLKYMNEVRENTKLE
jgi:hypothetical protein